MIDRATERDRELTIVEKQGDLEKAKRFWESLGTRQEISRRSLVAAGGGLLPHVRRQLKRKDPESEVSVATPAELVYFLILERTGGV